MSLQAPSRAQVFTACEREITRQRDTHVGQAGYAECRVCGRWVRLRIDDTIFNHVTLSKRKIQCLGGGGIPA